MSNSDDVGLGYWLRWQVPLCALIFVVPAVIALRYNKRMNTVPLNSYDLWVPCWRKLHPRWLLFYRVFAFVYMAYLLYQIVASYGAFVFYFYTQAGPESFVLVMVYFALGTIISAHGCWVCSNKSPPKNGERTEFLKRAAIKSQSHYDQDDYSRRAGFWGYLMQAVYQTCAGAAILTDIVFWFILVPFLLNVRLDMLMVGMHSLNAVFLLLDTLLNRLPFPWFRFSYFVLWGCLYVVFLWIVYACGFMWWPYPFLELSTPWAPLWYFALAMVHIPCYGLYALLVKVKISIFSRLFPLAFVR